MNSLNILHISDAHIQMAAKEEVSEIVAKMINDAFKVQKEQDIKIDLVCFTGDLIQRGDKALDDEKQMEIAEEILVNPVLNIVGYKSFSIVYHKSFSANNAGEKEVHLFEIKVFSKEFCEFRDGKSSERFVKRFLT